MNVSSRRRLLQTGLAATLLAVSGMPGPAIAQRGGRLRVGAGGASVKDVWDGRHHAAPFMRIAGHGTVFDTLTEVAADGTLRGELAETWAASPDAREWVFDLRRDVTFHDGTPFRASDVIASFKAHLGPASPSHAARVMRKITSMRTDGRHRVVFALDAGDPNFPYLLSDPRLIIAPDGRWGEPVGTGLYRVSEFEAGHRFLGRRVPDHYKDGRAGWFEEIELLALNSSESRVAALRSGRVDAIGDVPAHVLDDIRSDRRLQIRNVRGSQHFVLEISAATLPSATQAALYTGLGLALDRAGIVRDALGGFGEVRRDVRTDTDALMPGPDDPASYDPQAARAAFDAAGLTGSDLPLLVTGGPDDTASPVARHIRNSVSACGLSLRLVTTSPEGMPVLRLTRKSGRLSEVRSARLSETPEGLAKLPSRTLVPAFSDHILAHSGRVGFGPQIGAVADLDSWRIAERWWMS